MKKIKFSRTIGILMSVVTLATCFCANPVFAAEVDEVEVIEQQVETESSIMPYAGTETLPLGWYTISSSFTIDGYNYTPCKTVQGRYMKLNFNCTNATTQTAYSGIVIKIYIRDYNTKQIISGPYICTIANDGTYNIETSTFDLGYAGRKVQIYTQLYSIKDYVDTMERSVLFTNYRSYVSN